MADFSVLGVIGGECLLNYLFLVLFNYCLTSRVNKFVLVSLGILSALRPFI